MPSQFYFWSTSKRPINNGSVCILINPWSAHCSKNVLYPNIYQLYHSVLVCFSRIFTLSFNHDKPSCMVTIDGITLNLHGNYTHPFSIYIYKFLLSIFLDKSFFHQINIYIKWKWTKLKISKEHEKKNLQVVVAYRDLKIE